MLDAYRRLEAYGVIGKMMKVDKAGNVIYDPSGEKPGDLVVRPFQEFPKVVRRSRNEVDATGKLITHTHEVLVGSKSEELRLLAEDPDDVNIVQSPLERERDELARTNAEQNKTIMSMQEQMATMMAQVAKLSQAVERGNAERVALGEGSASTEPPPTGRGLEALALGKK